MAAFGSVFMPEMAMAQFDGNAWGNSAIVSADSISLHPGAHVLHYASTCFEGLKAFRHEDGSVAIFRMEKNIARMLQSTELLSLPKFDPALLSQMIVDIVRHYAADVPTPPGSM